MRLAAVAEAGTIRHDRADSSYLNLGAASAYSSVGQFTGATPSFSFSASGTLIAPDWILTAGHVVDQATSLTFTIGGGSYQASQWTAHSHWNGNLSSGYDIALVQLSAAVPGIAPASRYTGASEVGALATAVGFGKTGTGLTGATIFDGNKRAGQNVIDRFYSNQNKRLLLSDFDGPLNAADNAFGSSTPVDLEYLIAPGDSGGGLFVDFGQGPLLAGVHSFGSAIDGVVDSDYGDRSGHTRVSIFNSWIDSIIGGGGGSTSPGNGNGKGGGKPFIGGAPVPEPSGVALSIIAAAALTRRARGRSRQRPLI